MSVSEVELPLGWSRGRDFRSHALAAV